MNLNENLNATDSVVSLITQLTLKFGHHVKTNFDSKQETKDQISNF